MSKYLTGDNKLKSNPVTIKNIYISFTTAYGVRSILVTYKENVEEHSANFEETKRRQIHRQR